MKIKENEDKLGMWLLRGLCCNYSGYVAITAAMWQLQGLGGCYGVYVAVAVSTIQPERNDQAK